MSKARKKLYDQCKVKLLEIKQERLAALQSFSNVLSAHIGGDDVDIAAAIEDQDLAVTQREKFMNELKEIELALERIETGTYGMCEETEEPIEKERLLALPWTRLSLEGALIREREAKRQRA